MPLHAKNPAWRGTYGIDKVVMVQLMYRVVDRYDKKSPVHNTLVSAEALDEYKDRMKEMPPAMTWSCCFWKTAACNPIRSIDIQ
ncbi:MAG: hypothetical protein U0176_22655 [Bacteroidia bacterium]